MYLEVFGDFEEGRVCDGGDLEDPVECKVEYVAS
jgi:hypothetical protein